MFKVYEIRKHIPQDLPTHWSIYREKDNLLIATIWTNADAAQAICDFMNTNNKITN